MFQPVIFREYDIRGVFEKQFDLAFAKQLGKAFATHLYKTTQKSKLTVTLGRDARHSGPAILDQLALGLTESGIDVIDLGLITSPISYFSTFTMDQVAGAIMVTGSHNPPEYNGFKLSVGKGTIFGQEIQTLCKIIQANDFVNPSAQVGSRREYNIFPSYLKRYHEEFGVLKNIPVVLDCGNGAAGCIARALFEQVGLQPTILFEQPDGSFPNHHPDPTVEENLVALKAKVLETGAIVGIGFDGDADRIGVVDDQGRMIFGDELMVVLSRAILKVQPGAKIVGDVKCSDRMFADIAKNKGEPIMWKTGHSLIKEKIKIEKAPFGGEMSGHIFFNDRNYGYDDALYAALRLCQILCDTGLRFEELMTGLPPAHNTPELRIDTTEEKKVQIVEALKQKFATHEAGVSVNLIDGIRVSYPHGWALARASNTQPVLVLRFESDTVEGLTTIQDEFYSVVKPLL